MQTHRTKILRIIARLNIGGPAIHTVLLTAGLDPTQFESRLVTGVVNDSEGDMTYLASKRGIQLTTIPELSPALNWKNELIALYKLYRLIRSERPDIVHTHTAKAGTLGRIAAILAGVPCRVHTFHGHIFYGYFGRLKTAIFALIERVLARFTDKIVVISDLQYQELCHQIRIAPPHKFSIIPLGFELTPFLNAEIHRGKLREELGVSDNTLLVGIVGRLTAIKNHDLFLRSVARVLDKIPNLQAVIAGGGELSPILKKRVIDLRVQNRITFLGWRSDIPVIYADLDLVVSSSLNEGTPVCLIEAMACAKPVVATAVGGTPDIVLDGETGILVPSGDAARLSEAMIKLLEDAEKRRFFGQRGREFVKRRFSQERLISDTTRLYAELL
jgi:glycosyltransferase involved in cell wall biosynthesis